MIDYFDNFITSIRNLFWAFYGYLHPADYYSQFSYFNILILLVVVGNAGPNSEPTEHYIVGVIICGYSDKFQLKGAAEVTVAACKEQP